MGRSGDGGQGSVDERAYLDSRSGPPRDRRILFPSRPPCFLAALGWSVLAVEAPFFVGMLLMQWLGQCAHCRSSWLWGWPVFPGLGAALFSRVRLPGYCPFWVAGGGVTLGFIVVLGVLSARSVYWRYLLGAAFLLFALGAILTQLVLAA
jgi:hypothetical protein